MDDETSAPSSIGGYDLLENLESFPGRLGTVYRARRQSDNMIFAVKLIEPVHFHTAEDLRRFRDACMAAGQLAHPSIAAISEIGEHLGTAYVAMPFVNGRTLAEKIRVRRGKPWALTEALGLVSKIARTLDHAHTCGFIHGRLTPSKILLDLMQQPRVFGLGFENALSRDVSNLGDSAWPQCTPPECAIGKAATAAFDVYSLGAILYQLITGRIPGCGSKGTQTTTSAPKPPSCLNPQVDRALDEICLKCLQTNPHQRYRSISELAIQLEGWLHSGASARSAKGTSVQPANKFSDWRYLVFELEIGTVVLPLVLIILLFVLFRYRYEFSLEWIHL